jgi:hypothetical protein
MSRAAIALLVAAAISVSCVSRQNPPPAPEWRVFLIVMENHSADEALRGAFTAQLAASSGVATNYHAVAHPSVPNYLAITSGQTWGVTDDSYHALPRRDLGDQLTNAGIKWRAYEEGLTPAGCINSPEPYDPGHNPFAFYGGACPDNVVPFTGLATDLARADMRFSWIGPDSCHDQHSCDVATGDAWLKSTVGMITSSPSWAPGAVLIVTWDEDDGSASNHVLTIVSRPNGHHVESNVAYDHYSLLATVHRLLGLPRLSEPPGTRSMDDLLT